MDLHAPEVRSTQYGPMNGVWRSFAKINALCTYRLLMWARHLTASTDSTYSSVRLFPFSAPSRLHQSTSRQNCTPAPLWDPDIFSFLVSTVTLQVDSTRWFTVSSSIISKWHSVAYALRLTRLWRITMQWSVPIMSTLFISRQLPLIQILPLLKQHSPDGLFALMWLGCTGKKKLDSRIFSGIAHQS